MKRSLPCVMAVAVLAVAVPRVPAGDEPQKKPAAPKEAEAITAIVKSFFDNLIRSKADQNLALFVRPEAPVVGIPGGSGVEKIWTKKASELIEAQKADGAAATHTMDSIAVESVDGALAVARVKYHTVHVNCRAVFTFSSEGGGWKIAALVFETRLRE